MKFHKSDHWFDRLANWAAKASCHRRTFLLVLGLIFTWLIGGPILRFGGTWQLVINTSTTLITFLMVFPIQCTQKRNTAALHLTLNQLIRDSYQRLASEGREQLRSGGSVENCPDVDSESGRGGDR